MKGILKIFSPFFYIKLVVDLTMKWNGVKLYTLDTDNFSIKYWDSKKEKPPIILIQAFAAESQYSWHKQIKTLKRHFRVVVPNFIYFGGSTMKGEKSYAIKDQVKAIRELVEHLQIKDPILCGASYGGVVGAEYADMYPNELKKLVMTNAPLKYDQVAFKAVLKDLGLTNRAELFVPDDHNALYRLFGFTYYKRPPIPRFVFKGIYKSLYQDIEDKKKLVLASGDELDKLEHKEYQFDFPILLLWGAHDKLGNVSIAKKLKDHFGDNATLEVIEKTAHLPNFERPRAYNKALLKFLLD